MYKVNLIKGWQKTESYKLYRNRLLFSLAAISVVLIGTYLFLLVRYVLLQRELTALSNNQLLSLQGQQYSVESLTKTLYSLKKIAQIEQIYLDYPDYFRYHKFLLKKILRYKTFSLDRYELNRQHQVKVSLISSSLDDILELINDLESPGVSKYFSSFDIQSVTMSQDKDSGNKVFVLDFSLQFNDLIINEKG